MNFFASGISSQDFSTAEEADRAVRATNGRQAWGVTNCVLASKGLPSLARSANERRGNRGMLPRRPKAQTLSDKAPTKPEGSS